MFKRFLLLTIVVSVFSAMGHVLAAELSAYDEDGPVGDNGLDFYFEDMGHGNIIPTVNDLFVEAVASKKNRLPILVMFSADDCTYCRKLEAEILKPMYISGEYHDKVMIRRVMIDSMETMRDFKGVELDAGDFADRYHVSVTPTVILLDSNGEALAPKILGINTVDFYSAYLDQAIDHSYKTLNP